MTGLEPATRSPSYLGKPLYQIESTLHCEGKEKLQKSALEHNLFWVSILVLMEVKREAILAQIVADLNGFNPLPSLV